MIALSPAAVPSRDAPIDAGNGQAICLFTPQLDDPARGEPTGLVPLPRPTIYAAGDFRSILIERNGLIVWRGVPAPGQVIRGPIAWPIEPILPGESLLLRLQPVNAGPDAFAAIQLTGADAMTMQRAEALLAGLGRDPAVWLSTITRELEQGSLSLGIALLFASEGPSSAELDALRWSLIQQGCSGEGGPGNATPP